MLDPSWSELHNFANFLNVQLKDCEQSYYCMDIFADDLPGFLTFVVKFMIRMSKVNKLLLTFALVFLDKLVDWTSQNSL